MLGDNKELVKFIEKRYPGPYGVSLFFGDPDFEIVADFYKERGWKVLCAGTRSDVSFLNNTYKGIADYEYVVSNDFTTAIFYAAYMAKSVQIIRDYLTPNSIYDLYAGERDFDKLSKYLFDGVDPLRAKIIGSQELGAEFIRTPNELKKMLGWDSVWRSKAASVISLLVDLKYGRIYRLGLGDLSH